MKSAYCFIPMMGKNILTHAMDNFVPVSIVKIEVLNMNHKFMIFTSTICLMHLISPFSWCINEPRDVFYIEWW